MASSDSRSWRNSQNCAPIGARVSTSNSPSAGLNAPKPLPSEVAGLAGRAEAANLVGIYAALAGTGVAQVLAEHGGQGFGAFKPALGELLVETLAPIAARFRDLREDREALDAILAQGSARARDLAAPTLDATYSALGLVRGGAA